MDRARKDMDICPVAIVERKYPFPYRTRKSSSLTPMILPLRRESRQPPGFFFNRPVVGVL